MFSEMTVEQEKSEKGRGSRTTRARRRRHRSNGLDYDLVVIGTGMGGSAAGAIAALHGLKTLILDRNPRPGGACSYYEKQGFHVDTGAHLFIRGNKGPFGDCTRRLGMGTPITFLHTEPTSLLRGMNLDVVLPKSLIGRLLVGPVAAWQLKISPRHYASIIRLFWDVLMMGQHEIEALDRVTIDEFMLRYTDDPAVRMMLGMLLGLFFILPPWEASAGESIWNLQRLVWEDNLGYPKGGSVAIPKAFLKGAEKHGARVRLGAGVRTIEISNGKVTGVVLETGERIGTRAVVSTTSLEDLVFRLTGPEHYPEPYVRRVEAIKPSWTAVQAKIALDKKLVARAGSVVGAAPVKFEGRFTDEVVRGVISELEKGIRGTVIPIYAPVPSNYDPDLAPEGCQIITAVAVAPTLKVSPKQDSRIWIDSMMRALGEIVPGLERHTIFCDTWSVQTLAGWIGKSSGSAITTSQTADQVGIRRPSHHTPVRGLYIAGDCGGLARGVGTELACQSGMDCGDLVAHDKANFLLE